MGVGRCEDDGRRAARWLRMRRMSRDGRRALRRGLNSLRLIEGEKDGRWGAKKGVVVRCVGRSGVG